MRGGMGLAGLIALTFGLASLAGSGEPTWFARINLAVGTGLLLLATGRAILRARGASAPAFRGPMLRASLRVMLALIAAIGLERGAASLGWQADWSFEGKFEPAPALLEAMAELCERGELDARLYYDDGDARRRSTRVLVETLRTDSCVQFEERRIDDHPEDEDRFAIGSSNTLVFLARGERGETWETVERPTQGALYEALFRLRQLRSGTVYVARGSGEGDFNDVGKRDYSGLTAALQTEGYVVNEFVSAAATRIPDDASVVLWVNPERELAENAQAALQTYLEGGGRLVALLEPGSDSGLEEALATWGIEPLPGVVVDPASGGFENIARGLAPLAYTYSRDHPVARGLDTNRMTFFRGVRSFRLRKPEIGDKLQTVVFASPRAWIAEDLRVLQRNQTPREPEGADRDYWPLVVSGRYERGETETRIVAFGDAEFASNHYLRSLYNLDLILNAVHWAAEQEPTITLRPKEGVSGRMQVPLAVQNTLTLYQSLGLLLPELLLLAAALLWVRTRS